MHKNWLHGRDSRIDERFEDYRLVIGTNRSDFHSGDATKDIAFGRGGTDFLTGDGDDDELVGGDGTDILRAGAGMDHLLGGAGGDVLDGGDEGDTLRGEGGSDFLNEGPGHGDLEGGPGADTLVGGPGADAFAVDPNSGHDVIFDFVPGRGMFDHLALRDIRPEELRFEETFLGTRISWNGGRGSVLLVGVEKSELAQNDFMFADDRYLIQPTDEDADRVSAISFAKDEGGNLAAPPAVGESPGSEEYEFDEYHVKFGVSGADTFQGTADRDNYFGLSGDDKLYGGAENDHLAGDVGADTLDGGEGMDDLRGGDGGDRLYGGAMADNLMGEAGADTLWAGAGHDMLDAGMGDDTLHGGDGADAFVVMPDSGNDTIIGGFDAGPGAFDHIAFVDIAPEDVTLQEAFGGVLVSWGTGSILIQGVQVSQMSQDDFMFSSVEGGAFVNDARVQEAGTYFVFT